MSSVHALSAWDLSNLCSKPQTTHQTLTDKWMVVWTFDCVHVEPRDTHCLPENDWSDGYWQVIIRSWHCQWLVNVNIVMIPARWKKMSLIVNGVSHVCFPKGKMLFWLLLFSISPSSYNHKKRKESAERMFPPRGGTGRHPSDLFPSLLTGTTRASWNAGGSQRVDLASKISQVLWALDQNFTI